MVSLAAWKGLSIGWKIFSVVGPIVLTIGAYKAWEWKQQDIGYDKREAELQEDVKEQQKSVRMVEAQQYDALLAVVERTAQESKKFHHNLLQSKKESAQKDAEIQRLESFITASQHSRPDVEVRYVDVTQPDTCTVPAHVTARVDELAGVLNAIPYRSVPGNDRTDTEPLIQGSGAATCAQLIARLELLTSRLGDSLVAHRGLTEYVERERAINKTFHVHERNQ